VQNNGWDFLGTLRGAARSVAAAEGRHWPYFVGENDPKFWDITNPAWGVMDGQWDIDEVYRFRDVSYDPWQPSDDHAPGLKADMDKPQAWGRPYFEATRFGESHDMVRGQEVGETRFFSFDNNGPVTNPQVHDLPPSSATDNTRVLAWFRSLMGL